eukprot:gene18446-biopygen5421
MSYRPAVGHIKFARSELRKFTSFFGIDIKYTTGHGVDGVGVPTIQTMAWMEVTLTFGQFSGSRKSQSRVRKLANSQWGEIRDVAGTELLESTEN